MKTSWLVRILNVLVGIWETGTISSTLHVNFVFSQVNLEAFRETKETVQLVAKMNWTYIRHSCIFVSLLHSRRTTLFLCSCLSFHSQFLVTITRFVFSNVYIKVSSKWSYFSAGKKKKKQGQIFPSPGNVPYKALGNSSLSVFF